MESVAPLCTLRDPHDMASASSTLPLCPVGSMAMLLNQPQLLEFLTPSHPAPFPLNSTTLSPPYLVNTFCFLTLEAASSNKSSLRSPLHSSWVQCPLVSILLWFKCVPQSSCVGNLIPNEVMLSCGACWEVFGSWGHHPDEWMNAIIVKVHSSRARWLTPIILALWEA